MSRPRRYPYKVEFWTTPQQWEGLQLLIADELTDVATQMRQALAFYLRQSGIAVAPKPAATNGTAHPHQQAPAA